jgi:hypothetical protein
MAAARYMTFFSIVHLHLRVTKKCLKDTN